jgi:hypothetical protein
MLTKNVLGMGRIGLGLGRFIMGNIVTRSLKASDLTV